MAAPKLRFKEFDNDWINTKVKDLGEFSSGGTPSKDIHDYWNGNIPWISSSDLNEESIFDIRINRFISEDAIKNSATKKIPKNSILLVSRVGVGKVALTNQELCTSQDFTALTPKKDYALFIAYLMKNITPRLLDLNQGTSIKGFVREDLISLPISLASKEEQTKIASFLSAVDEKISQLTQKHALLSQYKQGMMQKLFSQQIRFKADDGSEFGEWEETSLHTFLCESLIKGSKGNKAKKLTVKLWGKGVIPKNEAFQGSENTQYYKRSAGQLIYGKLDFLNCAFGLIPEYLDGFESTIDAPAFDIDNKIVHPYFLINRFLQKDFYQKNGEEADGSRKAKRINQSVFLAMQIDLPCLEEQTKIANFLSAIDQKIEVVAQQIEQAKQWKKGLLQQMFV